MASFSTVLPTERRFRLQRNAAAAHPGQYLILVEKAQVVDGVEGGCMIRAPCFLVSIQHPTKHLFRFVMLALIYMEKAEIMESTLNITGYAAVQNIDIVKFLYTSVRIWEQSPLRNSRVVLVQGAHLQPESER